jgi:hypothetical protein
VILLKVAVNFSHKAVRSESAVSSTAISAKVHFSVLDEAEKALDKKSDETQKHPNSGVASTLEMSYGSTRGRRHRHHSALCDLQGGRIVGSG